MKQIIYIESLLKVFLPRAQLTTLKFRILSINTSHHNILPNCKTQSPMHGPNRPTIHFDLAAIPSTGTHPSPTFLQHQSTSTNISTHSKFSQTTEPQTLLPNPTYLEEAIFPSLLIDPLISLYATIYIHIYTHVYTIHTMYIYIHMRGGKVKPLTQAKYSKNPPEVNHPRCSCFAASLASAESSSKVSVMMVSCWLLKKQMFLHLGGGHEVVVKLYCKMRHTYVHMYIHIYIYIHMYVLFSI